MAAAALALVSIHVSVAAAGSDDQASSADDIARKLADPAAPIVSVPLQCNYLAEAGPDGRYDNQQLKLQPVIPFVGDRGKYLLRPILPIVSNEFPAHEDGFGDLFVQGYYIPRRAAAKTEIGFGAAVLVPTASRDSLGTGKWSLGPAGVVVYKTSDHKWTLGAVANHVWSVAGDNDRSDVSLTNVQPLVTRNLAHGWTVTFTSETSYNWKGSAGEKWTIPLGVTASKVVKLGRWPISFGGGAFYNVERPDLVNRWSGRLTMTLVIPE